MGCYLVNALGERYMLKYHPLAEKAPRNVLVWATLKEIQEGRGPIYVDCRHLSESSLAHLKSTLGFDKDTFPDYLAEKNIDIAKDLLEITVSEGMQAGPSEVVGSGILINEKCKSTIEGLYAAGDCADQARCVHGAVCSGFVAGREAAIYSKEVDFTGIDEDYALKKVDELTQIIDRKDGFSPRELEYAVKIIMNDHAGPIRTEKGLAIGLEKLKKLEKRIEELKASNYHELMRAIEAMNLITIGKLTITAAIERRESRFPPYHFRLDYPETRDDEWLKLIVLRRDGDSITISHKPLDYSGIL
ncbi:MAG: FAD-binding protein, partial [Candidatus Nezhaarchaeales archaeon]